MGNVVLAIVGLMGFYLFLRETGSEYAALVLVGASGFALAVSSAILRD
jgi:hypothetical protein